MRIKDINFLFEQEAVALFKEPTIIKYRDLVLQMKHCMEKSDKASPILIASIDALCEHLIEPKHYRYEIGWQLRFSYWWPWTNLAKGRNFAYDVLSEYANSYVQKYLPDNWKANLKKVKHLLF